MSKIDDGGPAFPGVCIDSDGVWKYPSDSPGMSLRDHFAGLAMQGMLFGCVGMIGTGDEVSAYARGHCNSAVVNRAYAIADAMLAARKAGGQ